MSVNTFFDYPPQRTKVFFNIRSREAYDKKSVDPVKILLCNLNSLFDLFNSETFLDIVEYLLINAFQVVATIRAGRRRVFDLEQL